MGLMVMIALLPIVTVEIIGADLMAAWKIWHLILISAFGLVPYGSALVITLRRGDLSIYYPIIRSSLVFMVVISVILLGHSYGAPVLFGIALVIVGAFFVQYRPGARLLNDLKILMITLLAMSSTGSHTISDVFAIPVVEPAVFLWVMILFGAVYVTVMRVIGGPSLGWCGHFAWVRTPQLSAGAPPGGIPYSCRRHRGHRAFRLKHSSSKPVGAEGR
jgi:uncharacterized membrane protein